MSETVGRIRYEHAAVTRDAERSAWGRAARAEVPRRGQATLVIDPERDPLGILEQQNALRLPELVALRMHRMTQSPFAFYRGSAALQAADLAAGATTGFDAVLCGDAHIANFGLYASPQRTLVFDLNDFDEAAVGPWEWDVKRFVTSVIIAARDKGFDPEEARTVARAAASAYRTALRTALALTPLERYFVQFAVDPDAGNYGRATREVVESAVRRSAKRTSARAIEKFTTRGDDGSMHLIENPPTLTHVPPEIEAQVSGIIEAYRRTVSPDIALLLSQYTVTDVARRVVGVGSVGTRCFIAVLTGPRGEPLVLQFKEATRSVLDEFGGRHPEVPSSHHGFRVVSGQRILQAVSDPFLGYFNASGYGFYVRQFRDGNVSFDIDALEPEPFLDYVMACGTVLARAHSQSPESASISGYLGTSAVFDEAIVAWAEAYADVSYRDFLALTEAVASGRFTASAP